MIWKQYCAKENWHPAANLMPMMDEDRLAELAEDIREHGIQNAITLLGGKVLDGRNRLLACRLSDVEPTFKEYIGTEPVAWVLSQNVKRRDLTASQRAAIAFESLPLLSEEAAERLKAAQVKGGQSGGNGRPKSSSTQKVGEGKKHDGEAVTAAAKAAGTNRQYVADVKKIADKAPELVEKIKQGEVTISEAQQQLGLKQTVATMTSSESNEWYTPEKYIEAAREVLGQFDLDPASCLEANKAIKAKQIFTEKDDGLSKKWKGALWMNPPYGDVGPKFVTKLLEEYKAGNVTEAVVLLSPHTETKWFQPLFAYPLCFTNHRVRFWNKNGVGNSPTLGTVFVYLGNKRQKFFEAFKQFGAFTVPSQDSACRRRRHGLPLLHKRKLACAFTFPKQYKSRGICRKRSFHNA